MLDTETLAFQALLAKGRETGKVTYLELAEALSDQGTTVEQVEDAIGIMLKEHIFVVEKRYRQT